MLLSSGSYWQHIPLLSPQSPQALPSELLPLRSFELFIEVIPQRSHLQAEAARLISPTEGERDRGDRNFGQVISDSSSLLS